MNPGYADFDPPALEGADRKLALSLGPVPLKLANVAFVHEPMFSSILRHVRAVRVYVYAIDADPALARRRIEETRDRFVSEGWHSVLVIRDGSELVTALVRLGDPDEIRGIVVLTAGDDEVTYANAIGRIRPKSFDRFMREFGIGSLFEDRPREAESRQETVDDQQEMAANRGAASAAR